MGDTNQEVETLRTICEQVPAPPGSFTKRLAMDHWLLDYERWYQKLWQQLEKEDNDE